MTIDLVLLSLIGIFALLGAVTGAAKQVANVVSLVLAWLASRTLGGMLGPLLAPEFKVPLSVATVAATILVFVVTVIAARILLTSLLRRLLDGRDPEVRTVDRALGFVLGGAKVALVAWVMICALTFAEQNVVIAGKKLGVSPKNSVAFDFARRFNLFELDQFSGVKELAKVAVAASDPEKAQRLRDDPSFQKLRKDPRFQKLLSEKRMQAALERGDYRALLENNAILQLIQDPRAAEQIRLAASGIE